MIRVSRVPAILLALAIGFSLGVFYRGTMATAMMMAPQPIVVHAQAKFNSSMMTALPGSVWIAPLAETANADAVAVKISTVKLHRHRVPNEFLYVASGSANVRIGSMRTIVRAGDFMFIPAGTAHSIQSIGTPIRLIAFESPKMPNGDMQYVK